MSILVFGAMLAAGIAIPLLKKDKGNNKKSAFDNNNNDVAPKPQPSNNVFLKKGSKGQNVANLQFALLRFGGNTAQEIAKSGGADGIFGDGTIRALQTLGYPAEITRGQYEEIMAKAKALPDPTLQSGYNQIAKAIFEARGSATKSANFSQILSALRQMSNTNDYQYVSNEIQRLSGRNLVNQLLLYSGLSSSEQEQVRAEFLRMGLFYNSSTQQWSLTPNNDVAPTPTPIPQPENTPIPQPQNTPVPANNGLLNADRVTKIKAIQTFLQQKGLYKGKIDGVWGSGTDTALKTWSLRTGKGVVGTTKINEWLEFMGLLNNTPVIVPNNQTIAPVAPTAVDAQSIADEIIAGMYGSRNQIRDFNAVLRALQKMQSTADYIAVSKIVERETNKKSGVAKTLVNFILSSSIVTNANKELARKEFLRMGLKYNTSTKKWSLSGLSGLGNLATNKPTFVKDQLNRKIHVREGTLLGTFMGANEGIAYYQDMSGMMHKVPAKDTYLVSL